MPPNLKDGGDEGDTEGEGGDEQVRHMVDEGLYVGHDTAKLLRSANMERVVMRERRAVKLVEKENQVQAPAAIE
jgi:hypothetical protein